MAERKIFAFTRLRARISRLPLRLADGRGSARDNDLSGANNAVSQGIARPDNLQDRAFGRIRAHLRCNSFMPARIKAFSRGANLAHAQLVEQRREPARNQDETLHPGVPGQSHLIFGTGSTSCITTNQLSKLCCAKVLYKPPENLDAIALPGVRSQLGGRRRLRPSKIIKHR